MSDTFKAVYLEESDRKTIASVREVDLIDLPAGDVLVEISHSTLNYKDGLAITGAGKVIRKFPFVPGIDFAGKVIQSDNPGFAAGDEVVLTGFGVGERHWGGLSQKARVKGEWLIKKPTGLSASQTMAIGTAGFTAMLSVLALEENGITPDKGEILVTGAAGGVGSIATLLLGKLGYQVTASTGRPELEGYLKDLGASSIIDRAELTEPSKAPLASERFAGAIDSVGSTTLAGLLKAMKYSGVVAACGLAGGFDLPTTVFPFILRGVRLIGIDSVFCPIEKRGEVWQRLTDDLDKSKLDALTSTRKLDEVPAIAPGFLKGRIQGRVVIDTTG